MPFLPKILILKKFCNYGLSKTRPFYSIKFLSPYANWQAKIKINEAVSQTFPFLYLSLQAPHAIGWPTRPNPLLTLTSTVLYIIFILVYHLFLGACLFVSQLLLFKFCQTKFCCINVLSTLAVSRSQLDKIMQ